MFSGYCAKPFEVEQVRVTYADGTSYLSPDLSTWCVPPCVRVRVREYWMCPCTLLHVCAAEQVIGSEGVRDQLCARHTAGQCRHIVLVVMGSVTPVGMRAFVASARWRVR